MGATVDELPHCGKVIGEENHYILAGFNGGGMSHIFLTAKGIAKMIKDGASFEVRSIFFQLELSRFPWNKLMSRADCDVTQESGLPRVFKSTAKRLRKDVTLDGILGRV